MDHEAALRVRRSIESLGRRGRTTRIPNTVRAEVGSFAREQRSRGVGWREIAQAIESRDTRALVKLDGIGKRTAELIVAELAGKVSRFAGVAPARPGPTIRRSPDEEDALAAMVGLGEKRLDAERLLERVKATQPGLVKAEELIREMLKMRMSR